MNKPYCIASPDLIGKNTVSGGIRVMWGLFGWLLAKGQIAYINRYPDEDMIGIYPEIYHGNPMNAKTVVRYILNVPGLMGHGTPGRDFVPGPTEFSADDKLYYFSRLFGEAVDEDHYLFLPIANLHIFKNNKGQRNETCFLVGKGTNKKLHPDDSIEIDRRFAMDQVALANLLNKCHTFYCYDDLTAMMELARLCGCQVQYLGNYSMEKLSLYEPGLNGINCPLDADYFREHYIGMVKEFDNKIDKFIEETQCGR